MDARLVQVLRIIPIFAVAGWLVGGLILSTEDEWNLPRALLTAESLKAALVGTIAGLGWTPLLLWRRWQWVVGTIIGLFIGISATALFFVIWPSEWQGGRWGAWKSLAIVLKVYWRFLVPVSLIAGGLTTWVASRPTERRGWQTLVNEPDATSPAPADLIPPPG